MYRVLLERAAEKDLSRLTSEIHDRVNVDPRRGRECLILLFCHWMRMTVNEWGGNV